MTGCPEWICEKLLYMLIKESGLSISSDNYFYIFGEFSNCWYLWNVLFGRLLLLSVEKGKKGEEAVNSNAPRKEAVETNALLKVEAVELVA